MDSTNSLPLKMILPPDGRQTRIDFIDEKPVRKSSAEWWQSFSSWFRHKDKVIEPKLAFYAQQLEKEGYSEKSRKSYMFMMKRFFDHYEHLEPRDITMGEIEDYNFEFFVSGRYSRSYQLQFINAIKLYYQLTEGIELNLKQLRKTGVGRKSG
ncbi:MAG: phage integrase N-terminal SAM-like domain-containing protein [Bacteroidales bacterium]|nr:phage integrase N-terminal SAM-like domain-containing protein [Bacteroidales bacterium]